VSQPSVGKYRKELEEVGALIKFISRTGLDGRTTDTTNIGGAATKITIYRLGVVNLANRARQRAQ
jgi:hypothetical protein